MSRPVALTALLALLVAPVAGAQEPTFLGEAQTTVGAGDQIKSRDRALTEAIRQAIERAASSLSPPPSPAQLSALLARARDYVPTYRILDEKTEGGVLRLQIEAQVSLARLTRDLGGKAARPTSAASRALLCVTGEGAAKLRAALQARGIATSDGRCQAFASATDEQRAAAIRAVGGQGALVGTVAATPSGMVRGTRRPLGVARAAVTLLDASGRQVERLEAQEEADGTSAATAADAAVGAAVTTALTRLAEPLGRLWPAPGATDGVLARVTEVRRFAELQALQRLLSAVPGVTSVAARRFDAAGVELLVAGTASPSALTQALAAPTAPSEGQPPEAGFDARVAGDREIAVRILQAPAPPPPPPPMGDKR